MRGRQSSTGSASGSACTPATQQPAGAFLRLALLWGRWGLQRRYVLRFAFAWLTTFAILLPTSCLKVPITDINAFFALADATWFDEEDTLFVFYEVSAEQGLGEPSAVQIRYESDEGSVEWTAVVDLPTVHTHIPVDCGVNSLCGSASFRVAAEPRAVSLRLLYHREGTVALDADTTFNVVGNGPPHLSRSLLVYGVFDESNRFVQWRTRHRFPTVRNQEAERLGLRRTFSINDQRFGTDDWALVGTDNPYGYDIGCPDAFSPFDLPAVQSLERAAFNSAPLPVDADPFTGVCARSTVLDANGTFSASALARKNPQVRPAFPVLRSPVEDATPLPFFLQPCNRTISDLHEAMQRQRLQVQDVASYCTDNWQLPGFEDDLVLAFQQAVREARGQGRDMVLVVGLHQDEPGLPPLVESALGRVVPQERERSTPRLAGAFVYDSLSRRLDNSLISNLVLWCPTDLSEDLLAEFPDASVRTCAVIPDNPQFDLGPFSFSALPVLPAREAYLDFVDEFSESVAGRVDRLTYRVPAFTPTTQNLDVFPLGSASFINDEFLNASPEQSFSYCGEADPLRVVFRTPLLRDPAIQAAVCALADAAETGDGAMPPSPGTPGAADAGVQNGDAGDDRASADAAAPADAGVADGLEGPLSVFGDIDPCEAVEFGILPIAALPLYHEAVSESRYELGILWDFAFLLRIDYRFEVAGSASAFSFSVPFGLEFEAEAFLGTPLWVDDAIDLERALLQCTRFCDHPTFDSAGVYNVNETFRETFQVTCYEPVYPVLGDGGFPIDP